MKPYDDVNVVRVIFQRVKAIVKQPVAATSEEDRWLALITLYFAPQPAPRRNPLNLHNNPRLEAAAVLAGAVEAHGASVALAGWGWWNSSSGIWGSEAFPVGTLKFLQVSPSGSPGWHADGWKVTLAASVRAATPPKPSNTNISHEKEGLARVGRLGLPHLSPHRSRGGRAAPACRASAPASGDPRLVRTENRGMRKLDGSRLAAG